MSVIAAAFHPKFRLVWLEKHNQAYVPRDTKAMETAVETGLQEHEMAQEATSTASSIDEDDDFFSGITRSKNNGRRSRRNRLHRDATLLLLVLIYKYFWQLRFIVNSDSKQ